MLAGTITQEQEIGKLTNYNIHNPQVIRALNRKGIHYLFPIQYTTYRDILTGKDMVGRDQTGSGKTLAYVLPIINRLRQQGVLGRAHPNPKFVVILPTRELALQVEDVINSLKTRENEYKVGLLIGQTPMGYQRRILQQGLDVIVATPGRLLDHMNNGKIPLQQMQMLCLDQADQMLEIGFRQGIEEILKKIRDKSRHKIQILLFSATFTNQILTIAQRHLSKTYVKVDLLEGRPLKVPKDIDHISINYYPPRNTQQYSGFIAQLISLFAGHSGSIIIFCQSKANANAFYLGLNISQSKGIIHGDIPQIQRSRTFRAFKSGQIKCMISTNVSARGVDFPSVDLVLQLEPPRKTDHYVHRCGRTGRAGRKGTSVVLWTQQNSWRLEMINRQALVPFTELNAQDIWNYKSTGRIQLANLQPKTRYVEKSSQQQNTVKANNFFDSLGYNEEQFMQPQKKEVRKELQHINQKSQQLLKNGNQQDVKDIQQFQRECGIVPELERPTEIIPQSNKDKIIKLLRQHDQATVQKYKALAQEVSQELGPDSSAYFVAYFMKMNQQLRDEKVNHTSKPFIVQPLQEKSTTIQQLLAKAETQRVDKSNLNNIFSSLTLENFDY